MDSRGAPLERRQDVHAEDHEAFGQHQIANNRAAGVMMRSFNTTTTADRDRAADPTAG